MSAKSSQFAEHFGILTKQLAIQSMFSGALKKNSIMNQKILLLTVRNNVQAMLKIIV